MTKTKKALLIIIVLFAGYYAMRVNAAPSGATAHAPGDADWSLSEPVHALARAAAQAVANSAAAFNPTSARSAGTGRTETAVSTNPVKSTGKGDAITDHVKGSAVQQPLPDANAAGGKAVDK